MCAIAGIVNFTGEPVDRALLDRMIATVPHRGPDDRGVHLDAEAGLAHARLSIIDLSGGHQPMCNEDGSLWITFNGEIFNYVELRQWLESKGHRFATRSDTEVILHAYEEKEESCVNDFNGQWAFAIWDSRRRRLFLSRDRMGVRPLFYARPSGRLIFGSEAKAVLAHPAVPRALDLVALDQVFTFWAPLSPQTIFEGVYELPPGHSLLADESCVDVRAYWQPDYTPARQDLSEEEWAERLFELLLDATRIRLRADVPVGAYLSGGLDSTVITTVIKRFTDTPLRTFSVTFEDAEFDESSYQDEVTRALGTDHSRVHCSAADIARVFPDVIWHTECPIVRTAPAPLFLLSRLVRDNGYKVVLTGEGSDELLGGYDIFKESKIRRFWAAQPASRLRPLLLRRLYPYLPNIQSQSDAYRREFFRVKPEDLSSPFFSHLPRWGMTSRLKVFFSDTVRTELDGYDACADLRERLPLTYARWDPFSQAQYLETTGLLPGYILSSQGDRVAMAHSIEGRFPFLDHRVVEFAAALPPRLKMKALDEKHLLKRAFGPLVPPEVARRPKQPYRAPEAKSFVGNGHGGACDYVEALLAPDRVAEDGVFDPGAVGKLVAKARQGEAVGVKDNMGFVGVLSTQLVIDRFIRHCE